MVLQVPRLLEAMFPILLEHVMLPRCDESFYDRTTQLSSQFSILLSWSLRHGMASHIHLNINGRILEAQEDCWQKGE